MVSMHLSYKLDATEVSFLQYKHIGVVGEYTRPHFGHIQPCGPKKGVIIAPQSPF